MERLSSGPENASESDDEHESSSQGSDKTRTMMRHEGTTGQSGLDEASEGYLRTQNSQNSKAE